jgi:MbtH protein
MAHEEEEEDNRDYVVVLNHEEQYSIWYADREIPNGWLPIGKVGKKKDCLAYVGQIWTDMRPLSLRKWMAEQEKLENEKKKEQRT